MVLSVALDKQDELTAAGWAVEESLFNPHGDVGGLQIKAISPCGEHYTFNTSRHVRDAIEDHVPDRCPYCRKDV